MGASKNFSFSRLPKDKEACLNSARKLNQAGKVGALSLRTLCGYVLVMDCESKSPAPAWKGGVSQCRPVRDGTKRKRALQGRWTKGCVFAALADVFMGRTAQKKIFPCHCHVFFRIRQF